MKVTPELVKPSSLAHAQSVLDLLQLHSTELLSPGRLNHNQLTCSDLRAEYRAGEGAAPRASTNTVSPDASTSFLFHERSDIRGWTAQRPENNSNGGAYLRVEV